MKRTLGERRGPKLGFMALSRRYDELRSRERTLPPKKLPSGCQWFSGKEGKRCWLFVDYFDKLGLYRRLLFDLWTDGEVWNVNGGLTGGVTKHLFTEPTFQEAYERAKRWTPKS